MVAIEIEIEIEIGIGIGIDHPGTVSRPLQKGGSSAAQVLPWALFAPENPVFRVQAIGCFDPDSDSDSCPDIPAKIEDLPPLTQTPCFQGSERHLMMDPVMQI